MPVEQRGASWFTSIIPRLQPGWRTASERRTLRGYSRLINSVVFSPDGGILVSSENNGTVRVWETKIGRCLRVLSRQAGDSFAVAFHPDGRLFARASSDNNTIKLWDVASG